jgi:ATP-dependent Lhr-like helicase
MWGRLSRTAAQVTTRATPIAFFRRSSLPWILPAPNDLPAPDSPGGKVLAALTARGALFHAELLTASGLLRQELDSALWALVAAGAITADGFGALRTLAESSPRRTGRWSLLVTGEVPDGAARAEAHARNLLRRWGVVFRELCARELAPPWREMLYCLRRLEARGEVRGGRFVAGMVGEQFALPEAVEGLRAMRLAPVETPVALAARDPIVFVELSLGRMPGAPPLPDPARV